MDTSVFVSALISSEGASRRVLRECLEGTQVPLMGQKLFCEFEDVLGRRELFVSSPLSKKEREELFDAFAARAELVEVFYLWRPNLPDEGDNHLVELAVAGGAKAIVTHNIKDFRRGELQFFAFDVVTPQEFLQRMD